MVRGLLHDVDQYELWSRERCCWKGGCGKYLMSKARTMVPLNPTNVSRIVKRASNTHQVEWSAYFIINKLNNFQSFCKLPWYFHFFAMDQLVFFCSFYKKNNLALFSIWERTPETFDRRKKKSFIWKKYTENGYSKIFMKLSSF